jgi:hypothetical protein
MIENTTITPQDVISMQSRLAAYLTTYLPDVNLQPGSAMYDLVIRSMAHILVIVEKEADELRSRNNLVALGNREDTTSRLMLDDILGNWFISRRVGGVSNVLVTLEFTNPISFTTDTSYEFSRGESISFRPVDSYIRTYSVDSFSSYTNSSGATIYTINILASSVNPGIGSSLPPGEFTLNKSIPGFIRSYSKGASTTVTANETNLELVSRAKQSLSLRGMSSQRSIIATINDSDIPDLEEIKVVASGDKEMFRDMISGNYELFSEIHTLGKADVIACLSIKQASTEVLTTGTNSYIDLPKISSESIYAINNVSVNGSSLKGVSFRVFTNTSNETKYYKVTRTLDDSTYVTSISISIADSQNLQPDEYTVQYGTKYYRGTASEYPRIVFSGEKQGVVIEYTKADDLSTVNDILENVETRNLGCDIHAKLPYQVDIYITNLTYLPNKNSPIDNVPENLIKSSLADFITKSNSVLSKVDITSYLINNFYQFITTLTSEMNITYVLRGLDNFDIPYTATKEVSVEQISNQLSVANSFDSSPSIVSLETLLYNGVSDRTIKYYCSADYIDMRSSV